MGLNCKPGELAILLIDGEYMKAGSIVTCLRFAGRVKNPDLGWFDDMWDIEYGGTENSPCGLKWGIPDRFLRPLRDSDGEDEMIRIADLPNKEYA